MATDDKWYLNAHEVSIFGRYLAPAFESVLNKGGGSGGGSDSGKSPEGGLGKKGLAAGAKLGKLAKAANVVTAGLAVFGKGVDHVISNLQDPYLTNMTHDFAAMMEAGASATEDFLTKEQVLAAELGTSVEELARLTKSAGNVRAVFGGMLPLTQTYANEYNNFILKIGNTSDTLAFMQNSLKTFGQTGLKPQLKYLRQTTDAQGKYGQSILTSMDNLRKLGTTYIESQQILEDFSNDEMVRRRLLAATTERERRQVLNGIMARQQELQQLGMTAEAAKGVIKRFQEMGGKPARERIKDAFKAQMALSAMGIEGSEAVRDFILAGQSATEQQQEAARKVIAAGQEQIASVRGGGIATLGIQAGLETVLGKGGAIGEMVATSTDMSTKLSQGLKISDKQLARLTSIDKQTSAWAGAADLLVTYLPRAQGALRTNTAVQAAINEPIKAGVMTAGLLAAGAVKSEMKKTGEGVVDATKAVAARTTEAVVAKTKQVTSDFVGVAKDLLGVTAKRQQALEKEHDILVKVNKFKRENNRLNEQLVEQLREMAKLNTGGNLGKGAEAQLIALNNNVAKLSRTLMDNQKSMEALQRQANELEQERVSKEDRYRKEKLAVDRRRRFTNTNQ